MDKNINVDREELFEKYKGLIYSIAKRFYGRGTDFEELFQIGCVGFLKAVNGFDESFNTQFSTYAVPFITGELKKHFRDDGRIKVSRSIKSIYIRACKVKDDYIKKHGFEPTVSYIAEKIGENIENVAEAFLAAAPISSIYEEDGSLKNSVLKIETSQESLCEKLSLKQALDKLSPKLYEVIEKRYFSHMTQSQTAEILGTNQVQISRLEKKALLYLLGELK